MKTAVRLRPKFRHGTVDSLTSKHDPRSNKQVKLTDELVFCINCYISDLGTTNIAYLVPILHIFHPISKGFEAWPKIIAFLPLSTPT